MFEIWSLGLKPYEEATNSQVSIDLECRTIAIAWTASSCS